MAANHLCVGQYKVRHRSGRYRARPPGQWGFDLSGCIRHRNRDHRRYVGAVADG